MKKRILVLVVGLLLIGINGFAADGDLIVNGNVGIGTTSPTVKLQVQGNTTVSGNVGIGTTAPGYKLDVQGQIRATQGTAVYLIASYCVNAGSLTTSATSQTDVCSVYEGTWYYNCAGSCGNSTPVTCSNTLVGRLVAP